MKVKQNLNRINLDIVLVLKIGMNEWSRLNWTLNKTMLQVTEQCYNVH